MYAVYNVSMRLGLVQINPCVGAIDLNVQAILSFIAEAGKKGCDLVVFPELALCGAPPLGLPRQPGFMKQMETALSKVAHASKEIGVIVGGVSARARQGKENLGALSLLSDATRIDLFNNAFFFADGALLGEEAKIAIPTADPCGGRYFAPGPGAQVFEFRGLRLGINVGEDLWIDDGPTETQASLGATMVINIAASPFFVGKGAIHHRTAVRRAVENGIILIHVNLVGGQDELVYDGASFVVSPVGDRLLQAPSFTEGLFVFETADPALSPLPPEEEIGAIRQAIVLGIRDYVLKNGFLRVIIGLSGGIDSAVVAALAVEALGKGSVIGVFLPSEITSQESCEDAATLAERLGIELIEAPIAQVVDAFNDALPQTPTGITAENLQARTRGTFLMTLANARDALVLATGNKSEIAVGYNTLYGDTVGAIAPIADLYKTQVYRLAAEIGGAIPLRSIEKAPTAELRPDQRDEDDLPPYPTLDAILRELIEKNASRDDLIASGCLEKTVIDIFTRYYRSEYKRRQLPLGIKLSAQALRTGQRLPTTHAYRY